MLTHTDIESARWYMRALEREIESLTDGIAIGWNGHVPIDWSPPTDEIRLRVWRAESLWIAFHEIAIRTDRSDCFRVALRCWGQAREYTARVPAGGTLIPDAISTVGNLLERIIGDKPIARATGAAS